MNKKISLIVFLLTAILIFVPAFANSVDELQILKISEQDQRAVMKMPGGKMQIIAVGDKIGDRGKVVEIVKDRVVIEEKNNQGIDKIIIRFKKGNRRIERIMKIVEQPPLLYAP